MSQRGSDVPLWADFLFGKRGCSGVVNFDFLKNRLELKGSFCFHARQNRVALNRTCDLVVGAKFEVFGAIK